MKIVPDLLETGAKVIDLSGDYRYRDTAVYEKWYGIEHTSDAEAVYGLPEIYRKGKAEFRLLTSVLNCY